jgi:hypothetical protein
MPKVAREELFKKKKLIALFGSTQNRSGSWIGCASLLLHAQPHAQRRRKRRSASLGLAADMLKAAVGFGAGVGVAAASYTAAFLQQNFRVATARVEHANVSSDAPLNRLPTRNTTERLVVVVGGGVVGLATAYHLRMAGFRVRLLDAEAPESTSRAS